MKLIKYFIIILLLFFVVQIIFACNFIQRDYSDIYQESSNVFMGQFISLSETKENNLLLKFRNIKNYKGLKTEIETLETDLSSCGYSASSFKEGDVWLFFTNRKSNGNLNFLKPGQHKKFSSVGGGVNFYVSKILKPMQEKEKQEKMKFGPKGPPPTKDELNYIIEQVNQGEQIKDIMVLQMSFGKGNGEINKNFVSYENKEFKENNFFVGFLNTVKKLFVGFFG